MFTGFLIVLFVESAEQFFKQRTHLQIRDSWKRQTVWVSCRTVGKIKTRVGNPLNN
ncbi:hypothetical protein EVA_06882 [gut metagenome]|uniref:Uncharacterized protein n=1 Tax=gut metagenome TaxID=749906 RepID=J9GCD1_9ZZZZ